MDAIPIATASIRASFPSTFVETPTPYRYRASCGTSWIHVGALPRAAASGPTAVNIRIAARIGKRGAGRTSFLLQLIERLLHRGFDRRHPRVLRSAAQFHQRPRPGDLVLALVQLQAHVDVVAVFRSVRPENLELLVVNVRRSHAPDVDL